MSQSLIRIAARGSIAVVAFDLTASLASRYLGFAYGSASLGSYLLYLAIGYFAARASVSSRIGNAALAAGACGLVVASIGWAISRAIGPGHLPTNSPFSVAKWVGVAILLCGLAAAVGAIGGLAGRQPGSGVAAA